MAAWGTGLYQDDVAEDVKVDYYDCFREDGLDNEAAYERMLSRYGEIINDPEDGPVFWMALSDVMWDLGKLTEEVKEKALNHIDAGYDVAKWEAENKEKAAKRKLVLEKLREKLESPMPKEKKLRKKRILKNKWQIGDMYTMPIEKFYPRFPEMKVKYLLLIKVDDKKDDNNIQPVVYIKYLEEEYHEGMDINQLEFSHCYDEGFYFVIDGIAGRPKPKELTYVGNYGDISKLKRPDESEICVEQLTIYSMRYVKILEHICVHVYLEDVLGIVSDAIKHDRIYMTEQEYQEDCRQEQEREQKWQAERKAKEYYRCPWEDGDTFYLPIREEIRGSQLLLENGYVGMVMVKVGTREDNLTTNLWPVMLMCCVKKEYNDIESIIEDATFNQCFIKKEYNGIEDIIGKDIPNPCFFPLQLDVEHGREQSIPEGLRALGNIPDISRHCKRMHKSGWTSWCRLEEKLNYGLPQYFRNFMMPLGSKVEMGIVEKG